MDQPHQAQDHIFALCKMWTESFSKLGQAAFGCSPDAAPPELLRQLRSSFFGALAQSWDEFLRSPQFMEGMKQMMDHAVAFRNLNQEFLTKARHELGTVGQEDVEGIILAIRQLEHRTAERLDTLSEQLTEVQRRLERLEQAQPKKPRSNGGQRAKRRAEA